MRASIRWWLFNLVYYAIFVVVVAMMFLWIITKNATYWWVMLGAYGTGWLLYLPSRWARKAMLDELYK